MRLRHVATVEHYLQEAAAMNVMEQLSVQARGRVKARAQMLPNIARAFIT